MSIQTKNEPIAIGGESPQNSAAETILQGAPYVASVEIVGVSDLIFHRWQCEAVEEKANAAKGSKAKKSDNVESYVYRNDDGVICIPGEYLRGALVNAAKYRQDPRSPRKSAMDLMKAALVSLTVLAPLGQKKWDYEDRRRCVVQRNAITRVRPAFREGWKATFEILVNLPQYVSPAFLNELLVDAGRLIGVGDFRPTYGRFRVTKFSV